MVVGFTCADVAGRAILRWSSGIGSLVPLRLVRRLPSAVASTREPGTTDCRVFAVRGHVLFPAVCLRWVSAVKGQGTQVQAPEIRIFGSRSGFCGLLHRHSIIAMECLFFDL